MVNIAVFVHFTYYVELPKQLPTRPKKGSQNRAQMDPKSVKTPSGSRVKKTSKNYAQNEPRLGPKWGPKMEPKSSEMMSWGHICASVAPKWPPDVL